MIGVVGGGQLARMLVQAASSRQVGVAVQTTSSQDPAAEGAARLVNADSRDVAGTRELVQGCAGITFENEWVNCGSSCSMKWIRRGTSKEIASISH